MWLVGIPLMMMKQLSTQDQQQEDVDEEMQVCVCVCVYIACAYDIYAHHQDLMEWQKTRSAAKNYTYFTRDAVMNRAFFLVSIALFIIFCICVARGGVIDNMEWIR
jgi:hypothetical protein